MLNKNFNHKSETNKYIPSAKKAIPNTKYFIAFYLVNSEKDLNSFRSESAMKKFFLI